MKKIILILSVSFLLSACGRHMGSTVYHSGSPVGKAIEGVVVSARPVTIKDTKKVGDNSIGGLGGGVLGGILGSGIGGGRGNQLATVGGALAGAVAGSFIEDELSTSQGYEYIVKVKTSNVAKNYTRKESISVNKHSIDDDIKGSIEMAPMQTNLISVVQGNDVVFQPGQKVYVVYHNDRPRLVGANF